jgi:hypothetical protein
MLQSENIDQLYDFINKIYTPPMISAVSAPQIGRSCHKVSDSQRPSRRRVEGDGFISGKFPLV